MPYSEILLLLTAFGAQSLILPFTGTVAGTLWLGGAKREALIWIVAIGTALFAILVLKLFFLPCGHLIPGWHLRSPSGHAASAFAAYGSFAVLEARFRETRWHRIAILALGFMFAAAIACSRVIIHAHTLPETILGAAVGLSAPATIFWKIKTPTRYTVARPLLLALALPIILLIVLKGRTLPIEEHIQSIALTVTRSLGICL